MIVDIKGVEMLLQDHGISFLSYVWLSTKADKQPSLCGQNDALELSFIICVRCAVTPRTEEFLSENEPAAFYIPPNFCLFLSKLEGP